MSQYYSELASKITQKTATIESVQTHLAFGELTLEVSKEQLTTICQILRDDEELAFDNLIDVCGVDYSEYEGTLKPKTRYASIYHLTSITNNHRVRVKTWLDDDFPVVDSVVELWSGANWFEREAFDLMGILYSGHPDLRRILTDYGFIGHPLRKDFPMVGQVEMRYDANKQRVIYEPVSIEERVNIPRVVRKDNRYAERTLQLQEQQEQQKQDKEFNNGSGDDV
jgi:NADH-quinone oxidoreductase subunit C